MVFDGDGGAFNCVIESVLREEAQVHKWLFRHVAGIEIGDAGGGELVTKEDGGRRYIMKVGVLRCRDS